MSRSRPGSKVKKGTTRSPPFQRVFGVRGKPHIPVRLAGPELCTPQEENQAFVALKGPVSLDRIIAVPIDRPAGVQVEGGPDEVEEADRVGVQGARLIAVRIAAGFAQLDTTGRVSAEVLLEVLHGRR